MRHGCSRLPCCAPPGALPLFQRVCGVVGRRFSLTALLLKGSSGYAVPPSTHLDTTPSPSLSALPPVELDICNISSFGERAQRDGLPSGQLIRLRGRVERIRGSGRLAFLHLRQPVCHSVQVVCSGKELAKEAKSLTPESIIDVIGTVELTETPVSSTSCSGYEVHARELHILSLADSPLPFPLRDSNTKLDTRLNHRTVDLRTPLSAAMLRIQSHLCQSFRSRLLALDFVEMHSPKVTAAATEGHKSVGGGNSDPATEQEPSAGTSGSAVFCVDYFGRPAYLAQSPQLYKQMALMGDAMRVFEVGPVFRAEKSYTHRHLTEFTGLDAEFVIHDKYTEVLNVLEYVVCGMVDDIQTQHASLLQTAMLALAEDAAHSVAMRGERDSPSVTPTPAHGPIVYEVSTSVLEKYGLGDDTQGRQALRDEYMGRVGGCHGVMQSRILGNHAAACPRVLRLTFDNAVRLLRDNGGDHEGEHPGAPIEDFSLAQERRLGRLIRDRYSVDVYVIDQFPSSARPFYTMPLSDTIHERTRSYDMYLRGEEVCSGAQRMHAYAPLKSRLEGLGISELPGIREYVESFRYGAWPHGGFGLGLERIALFLLGASDIRQVSLFPRDPKRLAP